MMIAMMMMMMMMKVINHPMNGARRRDLMVKSSDSRTTDSGSDSRPFHFLTCVSLLTHVIAIVCPSVCPSHETAQPIAKLSSLPGSHMILVLWGPNFFSEFQ